ncbi:MAG: hypothetical protein H7070_14945, partial [Saprospiraceae bacterium]|nr:hypothetical protein [Pyrinomonadaceae bacterium]
MTKSNGPAVSDARYVEVALPLPLRRTFTYRLPVGFGGLVKLGSRLIVPFGKRSMTGYAVSLSPELDAALGIEEAALKNATELLDEKPLLTDEILKLTQWTADYYAASWGEILKASLPAGINTASEVIVAITESGRDELQKITKDTSRLRILRFLTDNGETSQRDLIKEFGESPAKRGIRELVNQA